MAVKEKEPTHPVPPAYQPPNSKAHFIQTGESLGSLAQQSKVSWQRLAELNWKTSVPEEINWYLSHRVGCRTTTQDGTNWLFQTGDKPGIIYLPSEVTDRTQPMRAQGDRGSDPVPTPLENSKRQEQATLLPNVTLEGADSPWVDQRTWAPVRTGSNAQFLVDGSTAMASMAIEIGKAKKFIYITDWAITPNVRLVRGGADDSKNALLELLTNAAKRDVQIRIMLYQSAIRYLDLQDEQAERTFEGAHRNIRVSRHRVGLDEKFNERLPSYWSHHQKSLVVDGRVAFLGGIDFYQGRWDTTDHPVFASEKFFEDADFYNPCIAPGELNDNAGRPRRLQFPRMPWHDVHLRIEGPGVFDVERNFVQRWTFQRGAESPLVMSQENPGDVVGKQMVQIIRSVCPESVGVTVTETSIQDAYLRAIRQAKYFIYIENQFFTSHFGTNKVGNTIADEIAARIIKAIDKKETFRVIIVLPVHPEGQFDPSLLETMHWQFQTIIRSGANSLVGRIRAKLGKDDISDYLGFYNLRGCGKVGNRMATEQIYVHAKMMVVDDNLAIIGSANINDRSLQGVRDSEICAIVIDTETEICQMNGVPVWVRSFAHNLRLALWQEHLGLSDASDIQDPVCDRVYNDIWRKTATANTSIYETVFPNLPANRFGRRAEQMRQPAFDATKGNLLSNIKGQLTEFPLNWLQDQNLESWTHPDDIYTYRQDGQDSSHA